MNKEIQDYQDAMVDYITKAKQLQTESGLIIGLAVPNTTDLVPVDAAIESLINMTTRQDLQDRLEALQE